MFDRLKRVWSRDPAREASGGDQAPIGDSATLKERGDALVRSGSLKPTCVLARQQAIAADASNARAHFALGFTLKEIGRLDDASPATSRPRWPSIQASAKHIIYSARSIRRPAAVRRR